MFKNKKWARIIEQTHKVRTISFQLSDGVWISWAVLGLDLITSNQLSSFKSFALQIATPHWVVYVKNILL